MIDLEKEKQLMINAMHESGVIEIKPNTHQFHEHLKTWCKRAELAQAEITELKQKLEKLESGEWISVKDRTPKLSDCILQGEAFLAWDGQEIRRVPFRMYRENSDITDWMPMPKPPKPTNLIDSFIADGGFDRVMGYKNGE